MVTVTGSGFEPSTVPLFGGQPLSGAQFVSTTQIVGFAPPAAVGAVSVEVTTSVGSFALTPGYLYSDTQLRSESATAAPGDSGVPLTVTVDNDVALSGYRFAVDFDSTALTVSAVTVVGTVVRLSPPAPPVSSSLPQPPAARMTAIAAATSRRFVTRRPCGSGLPARRWPRGGRRG